LQVTFCERAGHGGKFVGQSLQSQPKPKKKNQKNNALRLLSPRRFPKLSSVERW
jgi:hypothetical protein